VAAVLGDSIAVLLAAQLVRADSPAWLMVGTGALPWPVAGRSAATSTPGSAE